MDPRPVWTRHAVTPEQSAAAPDKFIAVGIDFGTTYSGVSWAFSEQPDQIREISEWPSASFDNTNEVQVPTQYDLKSGKWGYQVTPDITPIKWFKLLLLNSSDIAGEEIRNSEQLRQAQEQLSTCSNDQDITAVQVVGYYLKALWEHTYSDLKKKLDIDNIPLRVAITVPAIWPHYAQTAMREAAKIAGITKRRYIGETTLDLVQEPEAAGLSIMSERSELLEIQKGESFVVCDSGGGTVDVISYMVTFDHPFKLKECVKGDGKLSNAFRINKTFKAHLKAKTKLKLDSLSEAEYNSFFIEDWERRSKRSFSNATETPQFHLRPPGKAYTKMDRLRNKGTLLISREEMITFFSKSLTGIRTLVSDQCSKVERETGKPPKKILLVGGLGSSLYVHRVLDELFSGIVLRPLAGWSAVARGAVLRLVRDKLSTQNDLTAAQRRALLSFPGHQPAGDPPIESPSNNLHQPQLSGVEGRKSEDGANGTVRKNRLAPSDSDTRNPTHGEQGVANALFEMEDVIDDLKKKLEKKEEALQAAQKLLDEERAENDRLDKGCKELQKQVIGAATKSAEIPFQSLLHRPESEIVQKWANLTYDVSTLVKNHLTGIKESKMMLWAKDYGACIQDVTPTYTSLAGSKKYNTALLEATIWNMVMRYIFGNFSVSRQTCWAGRHRVKLARLNAELSRDFDDLGSERQKANFQHWKAFTTSIVSITQTPEDFDREVEKVVEVLEDLFSDFFNVHTVKAFRRGLRPIVKAMVDFDMLLCGQQAEYFLAWPPQGRHDVKLDPALMKVEGDGLKAHLIRFVVYPCLCRAVKGRGDNCKWLTLDRCLVW